jgi:hypothetical protein
MPSNLGTVLRVDLRMPLDGATGKTWRLLLEPLEAAFLPHELQSIPARVACQLQANPSLLARGLQDASKADTNTLQVSGREEASHPS